MEPCGHRGAEVWLAASWSSALGTKELGKHCPSLGSCVAADHPDLPWEGEGDMLILGDQGSRGSRSLSSWGLQAWDISQLGLGPLRPLWGLGLRVLALPGPQSMGALASAGHSFPRPRLLCCWLGGAARILHVPQSWHTGWDPCLGLATKEVKNDPEPRLQTGPVHANPACKGPARCGTRAAPRSCVSTRGLGCGRVPGALALHARLAVSFPHFGPVTLSPTGVWEHHSMLVPSSLLTETPHPLPVGSSLPVREF